MKSYVRTPDRGIRDGDSDELISDSIKFNTNDILYIWDAIDEVSLGEILEKHGNPRYIVNESFSYFSMPGKKIYCLNTWLESQLKIFEEHNIIYKKDIISDYCVNFCINKKQLNRYLAIKLAEIFNLDCTYSWSGIGDVFDCSKIIEEKYQLDDKLLDFYWSEILAPIKNIQKRWIQFDNSESKGTSSVENYGTNYGTWNNGLHKVFSESVVSLITESGGATEGIHFSEKTAYAMMGLTFPIWIGGKNQAVEWKKIGFDIFEDVIDHSYQHKSTVIEQCFYSVYNNLELLRNKEKLAELRNKHYNRLVKNRELLLSDTFRKYNKKLVRAWPVDLQINLAPRFKKYLID